MTDQQVRIVSLGDIAPNRRRGGDLRALLTPTTAGSTSGFMGVAIVQPGDRIAEHYHPYSEEFVYVTEGALEVDLDGVPHSLGTGQGLLIPQDMRHRFRNAGTSSAARVPPGAAGPASGAGPRRHGGRGGQRAPCDGAHAGHAAGHERPAPAAEVVS